jgi:hypothetical protein
VLGLLDQHGWDAEVAMPVLSGERLDPELPRELIVAIHSLLSNAANTDPEGEAEVEQGGGDGDSDDAG